MLEVLLSDAFVLRLGKVCPSTGPDNLLYKQFRLKINAVASRGGVRTEHRYRKNIIILFEGQFTFGRHSSANNRVTEKRV